MLVKNIFFCKLYVNLQGSAVRRPCVEGMLAREIKEGPVLYQVSVWFQKFTNEE